MSADRNRRRRNNPISGQFAGRLIEMLESPAYRALSLAAHRVLSRLEIELGHHGGNDNGALPCTYDHFHEYGVHRHAVGPAIRELEALGFIRVTQRGCAQNGHLRQMNLFRLTYRPAVNERGDGSHEWRDIKTMDSAEEIARLAREDVNQRSQALGLARARRHATKKYLPVTKAGTGTSDGNHHYSDQSPVTETITTSPVAETVTTSISRVREAQRT